MKRNSVTVCAPSMSPLKRILLLIVSLIGISFGALAQDDDGPKDIIKPQGEESDVGKIWIGPRLGVSMSSFGNNTSNFDLMQGTLNSFTGGAFVKWQIWEWMALSGEVMFVQTGANNVTYGQTYPTSEFFTPGIRQEILGNRASTIGGTVVDSRVMLNTIDLPLLAHFTPKNFMPKVKPYFILGPSFGFILNARRRESKIMNFDRFGLFPPTEVTVTNTVDNTSNYRLFDFAINSGVGSRFNIAGKTCFVEARYRWGISNVSNFSQARFGTSLSNKEYLPQDLTNHSLMLTTGIQFGLN